MKTSNLLVVLAILSFVFASCSKNDDLTSEAINAATEEKSAEVAALCGTCDFTGTLTEAEVATLMEMREEEKFAREVYLAMYTRYNYRIFANIANAENSHTGAVLFLITGFGLTDPTPAEATEFANPLFTDLYAQLTEKGSVNLTEALKAGAYIEEYDIADLQRHLEETANATVAKVYGNLLNGSKNHLKAFVTSLVQMGVNYTPSVITTEEMNQILSMSTGQKGNKNGNGNKNGSGNNQKGKGKGKK